MLHDIVDLVLELNSSTDADIAFHIWKYSGDIEQGFEQEIMITLFGWTDGYEKGKPNDIGSMSDGIDINNYIQLQNTWDTLNNLLAEKQRKEKK